MVCSVGSGRMAAMARLLAAGSFSQTISEEISHQKLVTQYINRELREADEANLLDEEDMHVFDLKPMTDPLHLVCCNSCKKPVKASHFAAHAELCRSLKTSEETFLELDGCTGHKKPPRKERKKLLNAHSNQASPIGDHLERSESINADDSAVPESRLDKQVRMTSSFSQDTNRNSACLGMAPSMDDAGVSPGPGNTDSSAGLMMRPTKRSKLLAAEHLPASNDLEIASGGTKYTGTRSSQEAKTYVPVPMATKTYCSQRSDCLRLTLAYLYYESSTEEHCDASVNPAVLQGNMASSPTSYPNTFSHDEPEAKREMHSLPFVSNHDQFHVQRSEGISAMSGRYPPAPSSNCANQFPENTVLTAHTGPVGMLRSKYLSKPYSFVGNSGTSLGTVQQPNGSVPVV